MNSFEIIFDLDDIALAAKKFLKKTGDKRVFTFSGELGAGKTTFISALCKELGVTEVVSSPTFAIIREYHSGVSGTVFHMDLYRIRDEEEAIQAGFEDCLLSNDICMVEWPEKAPGIFPQSRVHTDITILNERQRKLVIHLPE